MTERNIGFAYSIAGIVTIDIGLWQLASPMPMLVFGALCAICGIALTMVDDRTGESK